MKPRWADPALAAAVALLALWAYRRALGGFFSPDDLLVLEQAHGLLPRAATLWRALSGRVYFDAVAGPFGTRPLPYHAMNWTLHAACAALLCAWARSRGASRPAALLAGGLFAASRLFMGAVFPVTGVGELAALALALGSLVLASSGGVAGTLLPPLLFAGALLCKENVLLLPVVLLLPLKGGDALPARARRALPLLALSALLLGYLALSHVRSRSLGGEAYAMGFGGNLFHALATYAAWSFDLVHGTLDQAGTYSTGLAGPGLAALAALLGGALLLRRRSPLAAAGAAWWLLALAPVLPLLHHAYTYYLYAPFAGLALWAGGLLDALVPGPGLTPAPPAKAGKPGKAAARPAPARSPGPPAGALAAWAAAAALVGVHAALSQGLLEARLEGRIADAGLPLDPYVRKTEVARNAASDMEEFVRGGSHVRVLLYAPHASHKVYDARTGRLVEPGQTVHRTYNLLAEALDGGRALRLFYPQVDTVVFTEGWSRAYRGYDIFAYNSDGHLMHVGSGLEAQLRLVQGLLHYGFFDAARDHIRELLPDYPDEPRLRFQYAEALARLGDGPGEMEQLRELVRRAPQDSLADRARQALAGR